MIFEETTWADDDSARSLEALLFEVPDHLKNQLTEKLHVPNTTNVIGKSTDKKKSQVVEHKAPILISKPTGKKCQTTKHQVPVPIPKPNPGKKSRADKHKVIAPTSKPTDKKSRADERKAPAFISKSTGKKIQTDDHQVPVPISNSSDRNHQMVANNSQKHSGKKSEIKNIAKGHSRRLPVTNLQTQKDMPRTETGTTDDKERKPEKADYPKLHKSDWRKRAFSKLMQESIFPRSKSIKRASNKPQSCSKDGVVHDAKHRQVERDERATNSISGVVQDAKRRQVKRDASATNTISGVVHDAKRRKVERDASATNSISESRSAVLNRAVTSKLMAAQFRFINEQLYTRSSKEAKHLFTKDKKLFQVYHDGYSQQISRWPNNPLDAIITFIQKKPASWVIGDFGCGDARLARSVKNKVHSFDLVACNDRVTIADIAHVPLPNESLDVVVLCLSLMGTNFADFISEANRTLKMKGILLIAEIESRFKSLLKFKNLMKNMGFQLKREEKNSYFISFNFMKTRQPNRQFKSAVGLLKPCVYKKR